MDLYSLVETLTAAAASRWSWGALVVLSLLLAIWNRGRNEASQVIFPVAFASTMLMLWGVRVFFPNLRSAANSTIGAIELTLVVATIAMLALCGLIAAWSLATRTPLRNPGSVGRLLLFAFAPVVTIFGVWLVVLFVLAMIGF